MDGGSSAIGWSVERLSVFWCADRNSLLDSLQRADLHAAVQMEIPLLADLQS